MKVLLKDSVYIGYRNGYILTFQKLKFGNDSSRAGEEYFTEAKTYLRPEYAVRDIEKNYGISVLSRDVTAAFEKSKLASLKNAAITGAEKSRKMKDKQIKIKTVPRLCGE